MKTLLVVDDDPVFCRAMQDIFSETMETLVADSGAAALEQVKKRNVDVVLLDQNLQDVQGPELCPKLLKSNERMKIVLITAFPTFKNAVSAVKAGAYDYLSKPIDPDELILHVQQALRTSSLEAIAQYAEYRSAKDTAETVIVGSSLASIRSVIKSAAASESPIIVTGETGTGKNIIARSIHYASHRSKGPFISINCSALPESLFEDEFFGHEKGAFTGAASIRKGIFEMAEGGTLLLDEITEMPMFLQGKLLGAIEDRQIRRVGGDSFRRINVRLIAATNRPMDELVKAKQFRSDLFYRLNIIRIHIPPLRERLQDIPQLAEYMVRQIAGPSATLEESEIAALKEYSWPGNVRELRNILERAIILGNGTSIKPAQILKPELNSQLPVPEVVHDEPAVLPLHEVERRHIVSVLAAKKGNVTAAAKVLGISLATMKRRLRQYKVLQGRSNEETAHKGNGIG